MPNKPTQKGRKRQHSCSTEDNSSKHAMPVADERNENGEEEKGEEQGTRFCFGQPLFLLGLDLVLHGTPNDMTQISCGDLEAANSYLLARWQKMPAKTRQEILEQAEFEIERLQEQEKHTEQYLASVGWKKN